MGYYYVNPLGEIKDISYNYLQRIKGDSLTRQAQIEDSELKYKSENMQLVIWSIFAAIFLLIVIVYLRKIKRL
jgi:hypothetical protein